MKNTLAKKIAVLLVGGVAMMATSAGAAHPIRTPEGNLPMIQAEKIGEDTSILTAGIAVTTAVSMVTITVLVFAFSALLY